MSDIFAITTLSTFSDDEVILVHRLLSVIGRHQLANELKDRYYEGKQLVRNLGIAVPAQLASAIDTVVGWPGTAVDVLDERVDFVGFGATDPGVQKELTDVCCENKLTPTIGLGVNDSLVYGISFLCVGTGYADEPSPLVTVESPKHMTVLYDARQKRVVAGLQRTWDPVRSLNSAFTLFLPNQNVHAERDYTTNAWRIVDRDQHNMGRCLVAAMVNRPRSGNVYGRSEISPAVMSYTNHAVRTMLGMEVAREFYSAPQRYALGADESAFVDSKGNVKTPWESYIGRYLALGFAEKENGDPVLPQVGQFAAGSMDPYTAELRTIAQMLSSETGIPSSYLGFVTENPASADAIKAAASRLEKRSERRISSYDIGVVQAGEMMWSIMHPGRPMPTGLFGIWGDPATPTKSATTDSVIKLIGAGVLLPRSEVTWEQLGFDAATRARLHQEDAQASQSATQRLVAALTSGAAPGPGAGMAAGQQGQLPAGEMPQGQMPMGDMAPKPGLVAAK